MTKPYIAVLSEAPFSEGWAILCFQGEKAHHFQRDGGTDDMPIFKAACGFTGFATKYFPALSVVTTGQMPKCKRCKKVVEN